jgi:putative ABC transport system permease protein
MSSDLRYALRSIRTRPGFASAVIATLAIGIGASTAMFSLVDAALLRALPFHDANRMVVLWGVAGPERAVRGASVPEATDWRTMSRSFTDISLYDETSLNLRTADGAERIEAELVSAGYFELLGVVPARGRTFRAEEDRVPGAHPVVVVSHALWRDRFASDSAMLGRTLVLNERPFSVVGIMPEGFAGLSFDTDIWFPAMMAAVTQGSGVTEARGDRWLMAFGRLKPGITAEAAQRDLDAVAARLTESHPQTNTDRGVRIISLRENYLGSTETLLIILSASVLVFLLIACANVTSLQLVRATARQREIAVRLALGADRSRLIRQLLTEGVVLALLGGAVGALLAYWAVDGFRPFIPDGVIPGYATVSVDARVLIFSLVIAIIAGVACGLAPALTSSRQNLTDALKDGSRSAVPGLGRIRRPGAQQFLVATEVALALMLLIGAGLMARSLRSQLAVSAGFDPSGVIQASLSLPVRYAPEQRAAFAEQLVERLAALPGIASASVSSDLPLTGGSSASTMVLPRDTPETVRFYRHFVTPDFFRTLRTRIVRGRGFDATDRRDAPPVVMISEAAARRLFPGEDPVGRRLPLPSAAGAEATVIGVVEDVRYRDLTTNIAAPGSEPDLFFPFAQRTDRDLQIAVRSATSVLPSAALIRREIAALDPTLPLFAVSPLTDGLRGESASSRFGSLLLIVFSSVALILASIGLYGVISFVVGLSRREIAIRMALGAEAGTVRGLVIRNAMILVGSGVLLGLMGAAAASRLLGDQLFGVGPRDPLTFGVAAGIVLVIAFVASYVPASKATRVEPQMALKAD